VVIHREERKQLGDGGMREPGSSRQTIEASGVVIKRFSVSPPALEGARLVWQSPDEGGKPARLCGLPEPAPDSPSAENHHIPVFASIYY